MVFQLRFLLSVWLCVCCSSTALAEETPLDTFIALFDAMRAASAQGVLRQFLDPNVVLGTVSPSGVKTTTAGDFAAAVGKSSGGPAYNETIRGEPSFTVDQTGQLGSAVVPYVFHRGHEESHQGENVAVLVRPGAQGRWLIQSLVDTQIYSYRASDAAGPA